MSRTYRTEGKTEVTHQSRGKMRKCEMCDSSSLLDEMYPVHDEHGVQIGYVCEICSADWEAMEDYDLWVSPSPG